MSDNIGAIAVYQGNAHDRWLSLDRAIDRVATFGRFGPAHLLLAAHGAFPLVISPELLHLIHINFLGRDQISWVAEMDFMLSPLCRPLDDGLLEISPDTEGVQRLRESLFEVEPQVREVLLIHLLRTHGEERLYELADFLLAYVDTKSPLEQRAEITRAQRWIAQSYLSPKLVVQEMMGSLQASAEAAREGGVGLSEQLQVTTMLEVIADRLQRTVTRDEYRALVDNSRVVAQYLFGDRSALREKLAQVPAAGDGATGGNMRLLPEIVSLVEASGDDLPPQVPERFRPPPVPALTGRYSSIDPDLHQTLDKLTESELDVLVSWAGVGQTPIVIRGAAGSGKTTMLLRLAERLRGTYPRQAFINVATMAHSQDGQQDLTELRRAIDAPGGLLLLIDDAQHAEEVMPWIPAAGNVLVVAARSNIDLAGANVLVLGNLPQSELASETYDQALDAHNGSLVTDPDAVVVHNSKDIVAQELGDLQEELAQPEAAVYRYSQLLARFDEALHQAPSDPQVHHNRGNVLRRLGDEQAALSQHEAALVSYGQAVYAFEQAVRLAPDYVAGYNNMGNVLRRLGDLQAALSQHEAALVSYRRAVDAFDEALRLAPDYVAGYNNKGNGLRRLGDEQAALSQHEDALVSYRQAVDAFDEALRLAPDYVASYNNKGYVLQSMGDLQAGLSQHDDALTSYGQAIAAYDEALRQAPDEVAAHNNKGNVLRRLGELQAGLSQHFDAVTSYGQAIAAFDQALRRAPDYVAAHNNKGNVLRRLGELQAGLSQHVDALISYGQAIAAFDEALRRAPDYVASYNNKGYVLQSMGDLQAGLSQHVDARISYGQAIAAFDEALRRAPDYVAVYNNKGNVLVAQGHLEATLSRKVGEQGNEERGVEYPLRGCESLRAALAEYSRSLEIEPAQTAVQERHKQVALMLAEACGE